jgi:hypothetical protein
MPFGPPPLESQALVDIQPVNTLVIDQPSFTPQKRV